MSWQILALLGVCGLFAAALVFSISSMLALKAADAIIAAWRRFRRIFA